MQLKFVRLRLLALAPASAFCCGCNLPDNFTLLESPTTSIKIKTQNHSQHRGQTDAW
jgi:hypothetical protein